MNIQKFTTFKTILIALVLTISTNQLFAQTNNGIFFQAVARDNFSNPAKDRKIYVQSSIIQTTPTGTKVLTEEHQANTDATGVFSISLGNGVRVGGTASSLTTIDWSKGPFYLNLKVAITPIGGNSSWDYTKEWVDMGTTSFGAVPFALYSASSAKVDDKLNITDTSKMLAIYAKAMTVKTLETSLATKLTAADTLTMLAPYAKAAYTIDSTFFKTQLATKLSLVDSTKYVTPTQLAAKTFDQTPITNAIATKLNIADSTKYVTPTQLAAKTFDQTPITNAIATKLNIADSTKYVTPTQLAAKTFDQTPITNSIATKLNIADSTKYVTPTQLAAKTFDQTPITAAIASEATTARAAELALSNSITTNTTSITANATAINLKAPIASPLFTGTVTTDIINTGALSATSVTAPTYASVPKALAYTGSTINWNPAQGLNAAITLTQNSDLNFTSPPPVGSYGTIVLTQDATGNRTITLPSIPNVSNKVLGSTSTSTVALSTAANSKDILNFYYDGTNCYWNIGQGYGTAASGASSTANLASGVTGTLPLANGGTGATTASAALTSLGGAPLASPSFTGAVTAPIYASTPQALTDASVISWNPSIGLNASVTLGGNRTLSFSTTPVAGAYGTLIVTQDGTGNRSLTLPSTTNVVLGSTSTTSIALSSAANATDILNFYYDGAKCYWNIGQGYGTAATGASSTANLASGVTGTLPLANGGTGATTASAALTSLGGAPLASPTFTGTVSTSALSSTSITAPTYASTPIALTYTGTNINWNPALGLNAAITLTQNSGLNFTAAPPVGSYGTVVLTQDATGNRTITLPSIPNVTNKVLGSTSTSTVALSIAANSKDILNFYYDGTNCYWNIGQGYGTAATGASSTANLASGVTGTLPIANGGTGTTTLTGLVKGNGTGAMTAAVAGTDYQAPLTLTTTGTGAATLSGTTLNIPTPASGSSNAAVFLPTIVIGTQQWARLNLDVVTYRNGDIIPQVTDEATWNSLTTGAWCYYNNDPANAKYGKLYNWYAVNDPRGLAPTGWHIPTNAEWGILIDKLNSYPGVLTNKLKAVGADWQSNTSATNESGFTGLPGGTRSIGGFNRLGQIGMWWSSGTCAYAYMEYTSSNLSRSGSNSEFGISVRCVRD